jgi:hypothetical protein
MRRYRPPRKLPQSIMNRHSLIWMGIAMGLMVGCGGGIKPPTRIVMPAATVRMIQVVGQSAEASQLKLRVTVSNPNDSALPLTDADYRLTVADRSYATRTEPNVTIPANGRIEFDLPAVLAGPEPPRGAWSVRGTLEVKPLRTFDQLLLGWFRGRPRMTLRGSGKIEGGI